MSTTVSTETTPRNGVNLEAILGARAALTEAPPAAQFQWRGHAEWVNGTHSRTTIEDFHGLGETQHHRRAFVVDTDHPEIFASEDNGAAPVEMVLAGLAGCLTAGVATVAANRGIELRSVRATLEGDMDLAGILGIDPDVRNGFEQVRVSYEIDADASREELEAVVAQSQKRSAVFDALTNPTPVEVRVV